MGRRRRESSSVKGWLFSALLRFFGISSPAVLLMALLSYLGFKTPAPDSPADSPDAIAARAKKIIEIAGSAKSKLQETIAKFTTEEGETPASPAKRPAADDDDLMNVTYQELFEDSGPQPKRLPAQAPPLTASKQVSPAAKASERPPAKVSDRDRPKRRGDFPDDLSASPFR